MILRMLSGVLYVDKPCGVTSHDVVAAVRRLTGTRRVGHTGTLDPEASGLLILCVGRATKLASFFEDLEKTYWTVLRLGIRTDTQDATGVVVERSDVPQLVQADVLPVLTRFTGMLQQVPPMYSALKYQGQRLYRLARQGKSVIRPAREICIRHLTLLELRTPWMTFSVTCSKGTYVRTLCEDIGQALGCGAHMAHLKRCRIGAIDLRHAVSLEYLQQHREDNAWQAFLVPTAQALAFLPPLYLTAQQYQALPTRQSAALADLLSLPHLVRQGCRSVCYRLCTPVDETLGILRRQDSSPQQWKFYPLGDTCSTP